MHNAIHMWLNNLIPIGDGHQIFVESRHGRDVSTKFRIMLLRLLAACVYQNGQTWNVSQLRIWLNSAIELCAVWNVGLLPIGFNEAMYAFQPWSSKSIRNGLCWSWVRSSTSAIGPRVFGLMITSFRPFASADVIVNFVFVRSAPSAGASSWLSELLVLSLPAFETWSADSCKKKTFSGVGLGHDKICDRIAHLFISFSEKSNYSKY